MTSVYRRVREGGSKLLNTLCYGMTSRYGRLYQLIREARARTIMEIGTRTGIRAEAMVQTALAEHRPAGSRVRYYGFDLFENIQPEVQEREAALPPASLEEVERRLAFLRREGADLRLIRGDTKETLPRLLATLPKMDFLFIDGGHSHRTVLSDWQCCRQLLHERSVAVFDDYVNSRAVKALGIGVNAVVDRIDRARFDVELLSPVDTFVKDWGVLKTRLALVRPVRA